MLTPTERAQRAASHVVALAKERNTIITRPLIAEVVARLKEEGKESGDAHPLTLVASVRHYGQAFSLPVVLTQREIQYLWRAVFRHLSMTQAFVLRERLFAEQPDLEDSDGFAQAFSVTYFPKNTNAHWTQFSGVYTRWGKQYAEDFLKSLEGSE